MYVTLVCTANISHTTSHHIYSITTKTQTTQNSYEIQNEKIEEDNSGCVVATPEQVEGKMMMLLLLLLLLVVVVVVVVMLLLYNLYYY